MHIHLEVPDCYSVSIRKNTITACRQSDGVWCEGAIHRGSHLKNTANIRVVVQTVIVLVFFFFFENLVLCFATSLMSPTFLAAWQEEDFHTWEHETKTERSQILQVHPPPKIIKNKVIIFSFFFFGGGGENNVWVELKPNFFFVKKKQFICHTAYTASISTASATEAAGNDACCAYISAICSHHIHDAKGQHWRWLYMVYILDKL